MAVLISCTRRLVSAVVERKLEVAEGNKPEAGMDSSKEEDGSSSNENFLILAASLSKKPTSDCCCCDVVVF